MRLEIVAVADLQWAPVDAAEAFLGAIDAVVQEAGAYVAASGVRMAHSTTVQQDRVVPGLVAASHTADLLVMGSHKSSAAVGLVNGTLPLSMASRTRVPLVVVPVGWEPGDGPVLLGADHETGSTAALFAADEAHRTGAELLVVHAWDVPPLVTGAWIAMESPYDDFERSHRAILDRVLGDVRQQQPDLDVDDRLEYGRPSLILSTHSMTARLAVVGTHGRGAIAGFLLGSVGHDLLMNLASPVAIIPEHVGRRATAAPSGSVQRD